MAEKIRKPRTKRAPLEEKEIVVHVPKGTAHYVRIEEAPAASLKSDIIVRVSRKRPQGSKPFLGVIVK